VTLSVTTTSPAKEAVVMPFGMLTRVDPRNHVLDGIPTSERTILRAKGHVWQLIYSKRLSRDRTGTVRGVLIRVHIGAT